jgi:hypothetical protein
MIMASKSTKIFSKKSDFFLIIISLLFLLIAFSVRVNAQGTVTYSTAGTYSWVCPPGVTTVTVQCYGGGAAGGKVSATTGVRGGGGGGAFAQSDIPVIAGTAYTIVVGAGGVAATPASGGDTYFKDASTVMAKGGVTSGSSSTGGSGGQASASVGTLKKDGGTGGTGSGSNAGGGGGGAGTTAIGGTGGVPSGGTGGSVGGGAGGAGRSGSTGVGTAGSPYGGGGGGAYRTTSGTSNGGAGATGAVLLSWTTGYCSAYCTSSTAPSTYITNFSLTGGTTSINNTTASAIGGQAVFPSNSASATPGTTLSYSITMTGGTAGIALWVDWNQDNDFNDAGEQIYNSNAYVASGTYTGTIPISSSQAAGTYWIRVRTDYNNSTVLSCSAELQAETEDYPLIVLSPPAPTITSLSSGSGCAGSSLTINGTNLSGATAANVKIGGTAVSSITSNNATVMVVVIGSGTTGTVSVTTPGGTATYGTPYTVYPLPTATASYTSPVCAGSTLNLTGATDIGTSFSWTGPNSFTSTSQNPSISNITSAASGTYSFTATANGCSSTVSTANVTVNPIPTVVNASASSNLICAGSPIDLSSSATSNASSIVNFSEGFETFPPVGWTFINAGSGNPWATSATPYNGTKSMSYDFNASTANAWGITPGITLTAGTTYIISFWYKTFNATYPEKLKVTVGTLPSVLGQSATLWDCNGGLNLTNTTWAQGTTAYTPSTTGTYYFGYNCYSAANMSHLFLDDISITGGSIISPTFSWTSTPAGYTSSTQNPTGVLPSVNTLYTVTAQNFYGCTASNSTTVNIITLPQCATYTSPADGASNVGLGSSLTWTAPVSGGTPTGYKLYFGTNNPPTNIINGTNIGNVLTYHPALSANTTYYWKLVPTNCAGDASCTNIWSFTTSSSTNFTVGAVACDYPTIRAAYDACTAASPYIIEIQPSYAGETYPILLGPANAGNRSANNIIVIRPATGVSWSFTTGSVTSLFEFNGAKWVIIDGRMAGTGASGITMENTQTASGNWAISMHGGSTNNIIKYCTIKGSNADATAGAANAGVIRFADGTNSNNTIDNCTIRPSGSNKPAIGIQSFDGTNNNLLTISNSSFVDFTRYGIWASGSNNAGWTISNNNFYQTAAIVPAPAGVMAAIQIDNGGGYTISGNKIGGQAGGSSPYIVTGNGSSAFVGINFAGSTASTTNTITSNTINDISVTISAANTATPFCFTGINAAGAANFTIGGSGNANTIGDMTGVTHKIAVTSTYIITNGFSAINNEAIGTTNIAYNNIGSIDLSGITTVCTNNVNIIRNSNASGTIIIDNNTIGNSTTDNMNMGVQTASLINNQASSAAATFSVTNNTIQKVKYTGLGSFYGIYNNQCALTCTGNTISGINSTSSSTSQYCIYHSISSKAATISSNIINTIITTSSSSIFNIIYLNAATATSSISSNIIGTSSANNISLAGNTEEYAIKIMDGGTVTCNANTLQNITLTSTGSDNVYYGLTVGTAATKGAAVLNATNNTITDITTYSTSSHANESFAGLRLYSTGSGHTITNNVFQRLKGIGAGSIWCEINAIAIRGGSNCSVTKNLITDITVSNISANMHAICFDENGTAAGTWNFYNNAIVLNNSTNGYIEGIHFYGTGNTNTSVFYHNTIKISGAASSAVTSDAFGLDVDQGIYTFKNNVFQNLRTGGTANYAIETLTSYAITEKNDYLESSNTSTIGHYNSTNETFAAWNTSVGSTGNINGNTSPVSLDAIGYPPMGAPLQNAGTFLLATVADDRLGASRHATPYPGAYEPPINLPIEILVFTGYKYESSVKLIWETITETNNDYFTVEKSTNGDNFEPIATVNGAGNSNSLLSYSTIDNTPFSGTNYYRLKQTDYDGTSSYSETVAVNFNHSGEDVVISPNPFSHDFSIDVSMLNVSNISIQIEDLLGKVVWENQNISSDSSIVKVTLNSSLGSGYYFLKVICDDNVITKKILKYKD